MRPFMTVLLALTLVVSAFATDYTITSGYYYDPKIYQNDDTLLMTGGEGIVLQEKITAFWTSEIPHRLQCFPGEFGVL